MTTEHKPVAAVSACLFREDRVLLVKRTKPPYANAWSLPGGSIEPGETTEAAIRREIAEETGLGCGLVGVAGVNDVIVRDGASGRLTHHYVIVVFAGRAGDGNPVAGDDAADAAFFAHGDLLDLKFGHRTLKLVTRARALLEPGGS